MSRLLLTLLFTAAMLGFVGCDGDDTDDPADTSREFTVTVENVAPIRPVLKSGAVASPGGPDMGPAIFPGETASFSFTAPANTVPGSGMRLNLATMFVQSNDLFYAFRPEGLDLFPGGTPRGANGPEDVTDQIFLYDAGTEINEAPGLGEFQKPVQDPMATNVGPAENGNVLFIPDGGTDVMGFSYPDKASVIRVTIQHDGGTTFTVNVENVSAPGTIETDRAGGAVPLSPFAWAVHINTSADGYPGLYQVDQPASPGIELIAEDGFPIGMLGGMNLPPERGLADALADITGLIVPLSPPAYVVHTDAVNVFEVGQAASEGVELIAEDGFPAGSLGGTNLPPTSGLVEALMGRPGVRTVGAVAAPGGMVPALEPGMPGESVTFTVTASPGDRLSFLTMYVQSNDYFYGFSDDGLALFDGSGTPVSGDVTNQVVLYDAGTEVDEEPGVGPTQKPRQDPMAVDVGQAEPNGVVQSVVAAGASGGTNDTYSYPPSAQVIRVTITSQ